MLYQMNEESNIVRHKEDGTNYIFLEIWGLGIELSNIRKVRARKNVVMCYPGADFDFITDKLEVANGSRGVIIHVGGNNIRNRDGMFER